jgi:ABC-type transporter Mla MlaB component
VVRHGFCYLESGTGVQAWSVTEKAFVLVMDCKLACRSVLRGRSYGDYGECDDHDRFSKRLETGVSASIGDVAAANVWLSRMAARLFSMTNSPGRSKSALTYYMHDRFAAFRFQLAGDLSQETASDLDQARQTASSVLGGRCLIVDLTGISSVDNAGRELLDTWHGLGAQFVVTASEAKARIRSMTGVPITYFGANSRASKRLPGRAGILWLAALFVVLLAATFIATSRDRVFFGGELKRSQIQFMGQTECKL